MASGSQCHQSNLLTSLFGASPKWTLISTSLSFPNCDFLPATPNSTNSLRHQPSHSNSYQGKSVNSNHSDDDPSLDHLPRTKSSYASHSILFLLLAHISALSAGTKYQAANHSISSEQSENPVIRTYRFPRSQNYNHIPNLTPSPDQR